MLKLFTETPELLLPRQHVKFTGEDFTDYIRKNDMFRIERTQQIVYEQSLIIPASDYTQLDLSSETTTSLGLYPTNIDTLYEILVGLKGGEDILIYPQIPAGKYFARLEKPELFPNPASDTLRYIGFIDVETTPYDEPKLRIHTVKDLEPLIFVVYNDGPDYEKLVMKFIVNKCKMVRLSEEEATRVEVYREIQHYEALRW